MKVTSTTSADTFAPFNLTITFESVVEARRFYALFNHSQVAAYFGDVNSRHLRSIMSSATPESLCGYHDQVSSFIKS